MAARKAARGVDPQRVRLIILGLAFLLAWGGLGYRLFQVQVVQAADFADQSLDQRLTSIETPPDRGTIFDRNGDPLAITIEALSIVADPRLVENVVFTAQQVAAVSGGDWERMLAEIEKGGSFRYLIRQLEPAQAQAVLDLGLPGVSAIPEPKRVFPHGPIAAHVVGMVNIDGIGIEGLEAYYDEALSGTGGEVMFEKPLKSAGPDAPIAIPQAEIMTIPAIPGDDLVSTIDLSLQNAAYESCGETVERTGAEGCWIVALEVETGEVLAMVGFPGFDPERRIGLDGEPFSNFAIRGMYEPGSTQKLITFAAGLDTGVFGTSTVIGDVADRIEITPGACESDTDDINGCYGDFSPHETRDMTIKEIFTISSNVGTIKAEQMLGDGVLVDYMQRFGQAGKTGVDFTGETPGVIRTDPGCSSCLASLSIGYGVGASPLQMAAAFAAVGNDGVWTEPSLVRSIMDVDGHETTLTPSTRRAVSEDAAWAIRQMLLNVVAEGTGQGAAVPGYTVGGKTGTSDKLDENGQYIDQTMASFVGMAPIGDPKVVVAVIVDGPAWAFRTGGAAAAPAFSKVMEAALHSLGVAPDVVAG